MIVSYEKEFLRFVNSAVPNVKAAIYAEKEELFETFNKVKKYPAYFFSRSAEEWAHAKAITVGEGSDVTTFIPYTVNYKGFFLLEKQSEVAQLMKDFRFYWLSNPYLSVPWPTVTDSLPVGLRLLYIKIEELRSNKDDKGPLRYLECSWQSQLFIDKNTLMPTYKGLLITINNDIVLYDE